MVKLLIKRFLLLSSLLQLAGLYVFELRISHSLAPWAKTVHVHEFATRKHFNVTWTISLYIIKAEKNIIIRATRKRVWKILGLLFFVFVFNRFFALHITKSLCWWQHCIKFLSVDKYLFFAGLPNDFGSSEETQCVLEHLCEVHDGLVVEAKGIKEHYFKPYIRRLFEKKVRRNISTLLSSHKVCNIIDVITHHVFIRFLKGTKTHLLTCWTVQISKTTSKRFLFAY